MVKAKASTSKTASLTEKKAVSDKTTNKVERTVTKKLSNKPFAQGTGRRKSSVARVWLKKGKGEIIVNGKALNEYFTVPTASAIGQASFNLFEMTKGMLAEANLQGGGYASQADALRLGIARALIEFDPTLKPELKKYGYLTVDSRVKERKKYGQKAARAKFQFTKR